MSQQGNQAYQQGTDTAKKAGGGLFNLGKGIFSRLPLKWKLIILGVLLVVILLCYLVGGTSSAPMDQTWFLTPENAIDKDNPPNHPESEEELRSVKSLDPAIEFTAKLSMIIDQEKQIQRMKLEEQLRKTYSDKSVTIECDTDNEEVYVAGSMAGLEASNAITGAIEWARDYADNHNDYGYKKWHDGDDDTKKCPICNPGSGKGWNCIGFVTAAYYHGGNLTNIKCSCNGMATGDEKTGTLEGTDQEMLSKWRKRNGADWDLITNGGDKLGTNLKEEDLKPGDVLVAYRKSDGVSHHLMLYLGGGELAEAVQSSSTAKDIRVISYKKKCKGYKKRDIFITRAYRYTKQPPVSGMGSVSSVAENIAQTAERLSWPEKPERRYCKRKKGSRSTDALHAAAKKYYGNIEEADCCNFVMAVVSEALGEKVKNKLTFYGGDDNDEDVKKELGPKGFTVIPWDGKESSLMRGDIVFYKKKKGKGFHTYIYLGKDKTAEAQLHGSKRRGPTYGHLTNFGGTKDGGMKNKAKCVIVRHSGSAGGAGFTSSFTAPISATGKSYDNLTILGTIEESQGTKKTLARTHTYTFQSFCYNSGYFYMMRPKRGSRGSDGYIYKYDAKTVKAVNLSKDNPIGHGNGCTYCTENNKVYSITINGVRNNRKACVINPDTLEVESTADLEHGSSTIAYDRITNRFITGSGSTSGKSSAKGHLYIYTSDLKTPAAAKSIEKIWWKHPGDMCAYNGIIYCCTYITWGDNYVDMYSEETGKYLGSYKCPHDEIEGIDILDSGEMVLLFKGKHGYLQFTGINVGASSSAGGGMMGNAISKSNMEILAAYSVSLANSELVFKKDAEKKEDEEGVFFGRYFSKPGSKLGDQATPVKLYWFGKDRGKINYEGDLKKKVKNVSFYSKHVTITNKGQDVKITLDTKDTLDIMKELFGVDPEEAYANAKGGTKNGEATLSMATSTAMLLFHGDTVSRSSLGGGLGLFGGGTINRPVESGWWYPRNGNYGWRRCPFHGKEFHTGIDMANSKCPPIYAATDGIVKRASWYGGYGNCIDIEGPNGIMTRYAHLSKYYVSNGDQVHAGQKIAQMGSTGNSTGAHLHFEVHVNGSTTNPLPYLGLEGIKPATTINY